MATCTSPPHPRGRTLHVIDVENLVGGSARGDAAVAPSLAAYRATITVQPDDHVVLGTGTTLAYASGRAWPGALLRVGHGLDGADIARSTTSTPCSPPATTTGW